MSGQSLCDGKEGAVAVRTKGPVEDEVIGKVRHGDGEVGAWRIFPLLAQTFAVAADGWVGWTRADVESSCADEDVDFVLYAVGGLDSRGCDFDDRVADDLYVIFAESFQVAVAWCWPAATDCVICGNQNVGDLRFLGELAAHL